MPKLLKGKNSDAKQILITPSEDEYEPTLLQLTDRERQVLNQLAEYLNWHSRWAVIPDDLADKDIRDEWIDNLRRRLMEDIQFCALMIACLNEDTDTQNAFTQFMINQINNNSELRQVIQEVAQQNVGEENHSTSAHQNLNSSTGCDTEAFCGAMKQLTAWMDTNNRDFLQRLLAADSPAAAGAALSKNIPGFNAGAIGQAFSAIVAFFSTAFLNNYESEVTTPYLNGIVNELRCLGQPDCAITLAQLYAVFSSRVGYAPITLDSFVQSFTFAVTGVWTGSSIADVMFFVQIGAFMFMGGFVDYTGINPLSNQLTAGLDSPSDDCEEFDPCPATWCRHISGAALHTLFIPAGSLGPQAFWNSTLEQYERNIEVTDNRITIKFEPMFTFNCSTIRVVNTDEITTGDTNTKSINRYTSGGAPIGTPFTLPADADTTFDINTSVQNFFIDCVSDTSVTGSDHPYLGGITDIYISGYGTEPDWGEPCE